MSQSFSQSRSPRATLRLQLHAGYTLDDARGDLPYFARLGVSHLYLSPLTRSRPGSMHGYDVIDHTCMDPERGGEAALRRLSQAAGQRGMGILLDIVPNHMATSPDNRWWWDVLRHGRGSAKADWFDIRWDAPGMDGKLLAPFLGRPLEEALNAGELRVQHDPQRGLHLMAGGTPYPLAPGSLETQDGLQVRFDDDGSPAAEQLAAVLAAYEPHDPDGRRRMKRLLERQHYRLCDWRLAAQQINWRRFFEESGLIGVRVERDEVFEAVHEMVLALYADGVIDGLRIDHVDGLAFPHAYCRRLKRAMQEAAKRRERDAYMHRPWIVVEKILAPGEVLDDRWAVSGTTGYDFAADVGALQHDASGALELFKAWTQIAQDSRPAAAWLTEARAELLQRHFDAERNALLEFLMRMASNGPSAWTPAAMGKALDTLLVYYPVYRSYVDDGVRHPADQAWFDEALQAARHALGVGDPRPHEASHDTTVAVSLLEWLSNRLGGDAPDSSDAREAVRRFQQLTPPLAAKSLEDTVFYRYGCLLSRNEVGSDPAVFSCSVEAFHQRNRYRAEAMPQGLLATATHDHKRGEDVRARLAVISEQPAAWLEKCRDWLAVAPGDMPEGGPQAAFRYMLLQTLVGAWPPELDAHDEVGVSAYLSRVSDWMVKALREGKLLSSWFDPDLSYEQRCKDELLSMAPGGQQHHVLCDIEQFVRSMEPAAIFNGLIQTALRLTCPGVPDLYQGTEYRDFSLVDPDNRRDVDFAKRAAALALAGFADDDAQPAPVFSSGRWPARAWADGRVKQALVATLLNVRREYALAFDGSYQTVKVEGERAPLLVAFSRSDDVVVIAAVKCAAAVRGDDQGVPSLPTEFWGDTTITLPGRQAIWTDVLRGSTISGAGAPLRVADLLAGFPLAVLCRPQG